MANSAEAIVYGALRGLVADRVYPDIAPEAAARPYFTYQAVGGQDTDTLDGQTDLQNARMQVNAWADDRLTAVNLMRAAIAALTDPPIAAVTIGAPASTYEPDTKLRGSRQDFSIWFKP